MQILFLYMIQQWQTDRRMLLRGFQFFKKVDYSPVVSRASLLSARLGTFSPASISCLLGEKTLQRCLSLWPRRLRDNQFLLTISRMKEEQGNERATLLVQELHENKKGTCSCSFPKYICPEPAYKVNYPFHVGACL